MLSTLSLRRRWGGRMQKIREFLNTFRGLNLLEENKGRIAAFLQLVIITVFLYHRLRKEIMK